MILALRPSDLVLHEEGPKLLQTLGPLGAIAQQALIRMCGVSSFDNLEQVVVGVIPTTGGRPPRFALVATTTAPITEQTLRQSLQNSEVGRLEGKNVIMAGELGYYLPPDRQNLIVAAPLEPDRAGGEMKPPIAEAIANGANPAPLRREMEALLPSTDSKRLFTMLVAPNFPFTDGKAVWAGPTDIAKRPTELFFLGEREAKAVAFSMQLSGQDLFLELRVYGTSDVPSRALAQYFETRLRDDLPRTVMDYCVSLNPSPYSKKIVLSYPIMVRTMVDNMDAGATPSHAVFRCYLPSYAASSLAYGTYLALLERPGAGPAQIANAPKVEKPKNAHDILEKTKMDLAFPRDTLEQSMAMISNEIGVPIQILGGDLQLEGITKNQSFGLDEKGKSPGQILRVIMQKANSDGKLIYVIAKEGDKEVIHITTRASAAKRGDKLPPELAETKK